MISGPIVRGVGRSIVASAGGGGGPSTPAGIAHAQMLALSPTFLYVHGVTEAYQDLAKEVPAGISDSVKLMVNDGAYNDFAQTAGSDMTFGENGMIFPAISTFLSDGNGGTLPVDDYCLCVLHKPRQVAAATFNIYRYGPPSGITGSYCSLEHSSTSLFRYGFGTGVSHNMDSILAPADYQYLSVYESGGAMKLYRDGDPTQLRQLGAGGSTIASNDFTLGATNGDRTGTEIVAICVTNNGADKDAIHAAMAIILATL